MAQQKILDVIDREITKLQQVRSLLEGGEADVAAAEPAVRGTEPRTAAPKRTGRPQDTKRQLSEDARARIAAGQKRRWAKQNGTLEAGAIE